MISWLSGTIKHKNVKTITLNVNGVGYEIFVSRPILEKIKIDEQKDFFCYLKVSENAMELYGFETQEEKSFTGKVRDLISMGKSLKCTWVDDSDNSSVGYIKNKSYYGEVKQAGKDGHVIIKDNCMWSWSLEEKQGVKMCFDVEEGEDLWKDWKEQMKELR